MCCWMSKQLLMRQKYSAKRDFSINILCALNSMLFLFLFCVVVFFGLFFAFFFSKKNFHFYNVYIYFFIFFKF